MLSINNVNLTALVAKKSIKLNQSQSTINHNVRNETQLSTYPSSYASALMSRNSINKTNGVYNISFAGNGGNPKQILLMSVECKPFAKAGGMGDVNFDMPKEYNIKYKKEGKEIRTILPLYDAKANLKPVGDSKSILINADVKPNDPDRGIIEKLTQNDKIKDVILKQDVKVGENQSKIDVLKKEIVSLIHEDKTLLEIVQGQEKTLIEVDEDKKLKKQEPKLSGLEIKQAIKDSVEKNLNKNVEKRINELTSKFYIIDKVEGASVEVQHGLKKGTATLYKIDEDMSPNGVKTYFVQSPEVSAAKKAYAFGSDEKMYSGHAEFSFAALELMKILKEKEGFDPQKIQTTDWHTAFAVHQLKELAKKDDFYENKKVAHTVHNIGPSYQGLTNPISAVVNTFTPEEIKKLENNSEARRAYGEMLDDSKLKDLSENYNKYMDYNNPKRQNVEALSAKIRDIFPDKPWDKHGNYNPTIQAIEETDRFLTVSNGFYSDMQVSSEISGVTRPYLFKNQDKGIGIVNGLDLAEYTIAEESSNKSDIKIKVKDKNNIKDVIKVKAENKEFIQNELSKNNPARPKNAIGYLEKNPKAMLGSIISRFDTNQKGIDILINGLDKILKENPNAQIVFGGSGYDQLSSEKDKASVKKLKDIIEKNPGRVVLIEGRIDSVAQFMASGDVFFMPSTYEPCGLMQFQAMASGCLPIVSKTGGLDETVSSVGDKATGFKTSMSLMDIYAPENEFAKVFNDAYKIFESSKDENGNIKTGSTWAKMIDNALKNDSTWDKSLEKYETEVYEKMSAPTESEMKKQETEKQKEVSSKKSRLNQIDDEIFELDPDASGFYEMLEKLVAEKRSLES
ncbi:MAG: glycogen/starch synthase [bacterium]